MKNNEIKKFANLIMYSDVKPFEVVRVISDKTIEVREMTATALPWKKDIQAGGFSHHCSNQHDQKWSIESNTSTPVIRARLRKDGNFHSSFGRHVMADAPRKFYNYNF